MPTISTFWSVCICRVSETIGDIVKGRAMLLSSLHSVEVCRPSPNLVPRLFLRGRKDPGRSWSRGSQILGAKLKLYLGRGGRGVRLLRLENCNFCVIISGDKI
jgi:hypothetical protein